MGNTEISNAKKKLQDMQRDIPYLIDRVDTYYKEIVRLEGHIMKQKKEIELLKSQLEQKRGR